MADFIPNKRSDLYLWLKNLSDHIVAEAVKMGVAPADATASKALADGIIAKMDDTDAKQAAVDGARDVEGLTQAANVAALRKYVRNWKTLTGYPMSGSESVLKLKGAESVFDPTSYKPVIKASIEAGQVRIDFQKLGADGLAVYCR